MNPRIARLATRLYPRTWRDRYGEEFEALLFSEPGSCINLINVGWSALRERFMPARPGDKAELLPSFGLLVRKPSAVVPMGMSFAALSVVFAHIAVAGLARQPDEGAAAHMWQLLVVGQLPLLLFYTVKWLPKAPRQALCVLALQAAAMIASMAPVYLLKW